jgi:hypothetical protein
MAMKTSNLLIEFCSYFLLLRDARIHCLVYDMLTFSSMHIFVNNT